MQQARSLARMQQALSLARMQQARSLAGGTIAQLAGAIEKLRRDLPPGGVSSCSVSESLFLLLEVNRSF
jgi:hypothetical protein